MSLKDLRRRIRARRNAAEREPGERDATSDSADATTPVDHPPAPVAPRLTEAAEQALAETEACAPTFATSLRALDPWQLQAVLSGPTAAVVEAQVGSGKTTVLVHKVVFLHLVRGVPLSDMAVLTFTNKAAAEFRDRVRTLLAEGDARPRVDGDAMRWFGTFHALARTLLSDDLPVQDLGFRPDFQVIDTNERMALWQALITTHQLTIKHKRRLGRRMELLQQGQTRFGNMRKDDDILRLAELAAADKLARGVMDFDDLLTNAHALLAGSGLARRPAWLIVDELQDCDLDQLDLIDKVAGATTRRFYVGDPNQVIYSWRGSAPRLFDHVRAQHQAETFSLPMNYRSTATIVFAARAFLQGSGRLDAAAWRTSALVPARDAGEPVHVVRCHDPRAEAVWIAEQVADLRRGDKAEETIAVLARTRRRLLPIRDALLAAGIRVQERSGWQADQLATARWLLLLLRGSVAGGDVAAACAALSHDDHGLVTTRELGLPAPTHEWPTGRDAVAERPMSTPHALVALLDHLKQPTKGRRRKGVDRGLAATVVERLMDVDRLLDEGAGVDDLMTHLLIAAQLGPTRPKHVPQMALIRAWLTALLAPAGDAQRPMRRSSRFARRLREAEVDEEPLHRAARAIHDAAQHDPSGGGAAETTAAGTAPVHLLTMHAAKGLEWHTVFLAGLNAGAIPLPTALRDPAQLAEERRLFFVALTRARNRLVLSWCRRPDDPREREQESAFLRLLPVESVCEHDHPAALFSRKPRDSATATASESTAAQGGWRVGQSARHKRYGVGTIVELTDDALRCDFGPRGVKRFALAMCPLRALGDSP